MITFTTTAKIPGSDEWSQDQRCAALDHICGEMTEHMVADWMRRSAFKTILQSAAMKALQLRADLRGDPAVAAFRNPASGNTVHEAEEKIDDV